MENIIMATFPVESESYQAYSELKHDLSGRGYFVSQFALVKKDNNAFSVCEEYDTGDETTDDTFGGSLVGGILGILGGPIGVILGVSVGGLIGAAVDSGDIEKNGSAIERLAAKLSDKTMAIIAFAQENDNVGINDMFLKYNAEITRYDAAEIESEIKEAKQEQKNMEKQTRAALRKEKNEAEKEKISERRNKFKAYFDSKRLKLKK